MHDGEYGSPGTCLPLHFLVLAGSWPGLASWAPVVVVEPATAPGAVAPPVAPSAPLTPVEPVLPGAPLLRVTRSRALVGTNRAISANARSRQASGP